MAVAIRLSRDLEKASPENPQGTRFRKGQILRLWGWIHRPEERNRRGEPYGEWQFWLTADVDGGYIFRAEDIEEVYIWRDEWDRAGEYEEMVEKFRDAPWPVHHQKPDRENE